VFRPLNSAGLVAVLRSLDTTLMSFHALDILVQ